MDIKGRPQTLKKVNASLIVEALGAIQQATRVELAQQIGLSQPTVNAIMQELEEQGVIVSSGYAAYSGGRRAQLYKLNPNRNHVIAMWVTAMFIHFGVLDAAGAVLSKGQSKFGGSEKLLPKVFHLLDDLIARDPCVRAISFAVPGAVSQSGVIFAVPQLPSWEELPLLQRLHERYQMPISVQNDMNAVAYGYYQSALKDMQEDLAFVHVGKGIGAGFVVNGKIVTGFSSFAGEISYMYTGDVADASQGRGPFEILYQNAATKQERAETVARMVANIICILNPPTIAFGGSGASQALLADVRRFCERYIPASAVPNLQYVLDEGQYYQIGLSKIGQGLVETDIKLVNAGA